MSQTADNFKSSFLEELIAEGDVWRILRKGTLVDLIRLEFIHYKTDNDPKHLKKAFNNAIKYLMSDILPPVQLSSDSKKVLSQFDADYPLLVETYDSIIAGLLKKYPESTVEPFDLSNQISYLKIISQLDIDSYSDSVIEEVAWVAYCILLYLNKNDIE